MEIFVAEPMHVDVLVQPPSGTTSGKTLTISTTFGEFNPAASDAAAKATTTRTTVGSQPIQVPLLLRGAGDGVITVTGGNGGTGTVAFSVEAAQKRVEIEPPLQEKLVTGPSNRARFRVTLQKDSRETVDEDPGSVRRKATLEVTRGTLRPQLTGADAFRREITLVQGETIKIDFFPGLDAGHGDLIVSLEDGSVFIHPFTVGASDDSVDFQMPARVFANGAVFDVSVALASSTTEEQVVTLTTTHALLEPSAPAGEAQYRRTVRLVPGDDAKSVSIYAPEIEGPASITATLPSGEAFPEGFEIERVDDSVTVGVDDPNETFYANDETLVPLTVTLSNGADVRRGVTLVVSTGVLNESGGSEQARQTRTVFVDDGGDARVVLWRVGRLSGNALVRAEIDGDAKAEEVIALARSVPSFISLTLGRSVLQLTAASTTATAEFGRSAGLGRVSLATEVGLLSCCDPDGDLLLGECFDFVNVPEVLVAPPSGEDQVTTPLTLTPEGTTWIETPGVPPTDDLEVTLHTYVLDPAEGPIDIDCATLADEQSLPVAVAAHASRTLVLRHAPP
jgi:hypothetical protein